MGNQNPFDSDGGNLTGLARNMVAITPNDSADLENVLVAIECTGAAGNISVVTAKGVTVTRPITATQIIPCGIVRVLATGTTATGLWGYEA
jgi:hypothetical protein